MTGLSRNLLDRLGVRRRPCDRGSGVRAFESLYSHSRGGKELWASDQVVRQPVEGWTAAERPPSTKPNPMSIVRRFAARWIDLSPNTRSAQPTERPRCGHWQAGVYCKGQLLQYTPHPGQCRTEGILGRKSTRGGFRVSGVPIFSPILYLPILGRNRERERQLLICSRAYSDTRVRHLSSAQIDLWTSCWCLRFQPGRVSTSCHPTQQNWSL